MSELQAGRLPVGYQNMKFLDEATLPFYLVPAVVGFEP
jgi:hypothetical protein